MIHLSQRTIGSPLWPSIVHLADRAHFAQLKKKSVERYSTMTAVPSSFECVKERRGPNWPHFRSQIPSGHQAHFKNAESALSAHCSCSLLLHSNSWMTGRGRAEIWRGGKKEGRKGFCERKHGSGIFHVICRNLYSDGPFSESRVSRWKSGSFLSFPYISTISMSEKFHLA